MKFIFFGIRYLTSSFSGFWSLRRYISPWRVFWIIWVACTSSTVCCFVLDNFSQIGGLSLFNLSFFSLTRGMTFLEGNLCCLISKREIKQGPRRRQWGLHRKKWLRVSAIVSRLFQFIWLVKCVSAILELNWYVTTVKCTKMKKCTCEACKNEICTSKACKTTDFHC